MLDRLPLPRLGRDEPQSGREGYWEREKILGIPLSDLDRTKAIGRPVEPFGSENLSFSIVFFSNT